MAGLLGRKIGMTQVFGDRGEIIPVTAVELGPCSVLEILPEKGVLKLGYGEVKMEKLKKPQQGYFTKHNLSPRRYIREFPFGDVSDFKVGQELSVSLFQPGDFVDVTGTTKGKGFSGMIRRWGASRWPMSHGHPEHRRPGAIGCSATPSRVFKGKKMPGRYGGVKKTVQNVKIVEVQEEDRLLLLKGAVPGPPRGLVVVRTALKKAAVPSKEKEPPEDKES